MKDIQMFEWLISHPDLSNLWFIYITFHDPVQWILMFFIGWTAWGQRRKKQEEHNLALRIETELNHIHQELHKHMQEDSELHAHLGQGGMFRGENVNGKR